MHSVIEGEIIDGDVVEKRYQKALYKSHGQTRKSSPRVWVGHAKQNILHSGRSRVYTAWYTVYCTWRHSVILEARIVWALRKVGAGTGSCSALLRQLHSPWRLRCRCRVLAAPIHLGPVGPLSLPRSHEPLTTSPSMLTVPSSFRHDYSLLVYCRHRFSIHWRSQQRWTY